MRPRNLLVFIFLGLFLLGLGVSNFNVALAQGTYSCKWVGRPGVCTPVDNCADGHKSGDACENFGPANCNDAPAQKCVREDAAPPGPQTPPDLGEAGCYWKWDNFLKQSGKCKTKFECGTGAAPKVNLTSPKCEEIEKQGQCEDSSRRVQECVQVGPQQQTPGPQEQPPGPQEQPPTSGIFQIRNPLQYDTIPEILDAIAGFLYTLALAVVTVMVLWAGFQILTAAGNPEGIDKGKRTLLWAVIGTVVILVAGGIADLTADILGGKTRSSPGPEIAGTAGCSWVKLEVGPGRCAPDLNCKSGYTAPNTLNCRADIPAECGAIPVKNCVEK